MDKKKQNIVIEKIEAAIIKFTEFYKLTRMSKGVNVSLLFEQDTLLMKFSYKIIDGRIYFSLQSPMIVGVSASNGYLVNNLLCDSGIRNLISPRTMKLENNALHIIHEFELKASPLKELKTNLLLKLSDELRCNTQSAEILSLKLDTSFQLTNN